MVKILFNHFEQIRAEYYSLRPLATVKLLNQTKKCHLVEHGKVSAAQAKKKAQTEYNEFNKTQKINSDFDKAVKKMLDE